MDLNIFELPIIIAMQTENSLRARGSSPSHQGYQKLVSPKLHKKINIDRKVGSSKLWYIQPLYKETISIFFAVLHDVCTTQTEKHNGHHMCILTYSNLKAVIYYNIS